MSVTSEVPARPEGEPFWPAAVITFGVSLTVSWALVLAYGLFRVIDYVI